MRVAYFTNQYPSVSHSFIRREIQALERLGVTVERFAIRPSSVAFQSAEDAAEEEKTRHIIRECKTALVWSMFRVLLSRPISTMKAFYKALSFSRGSEAGLVRHVFYFAEALVLADWLSRGRLAHVHAHFGTNAAMIAMLAAQIADIRYSFTVHGPEEFEKANAISLSDKAGDAAFVATISSYGAAQMKKLCDPEIWSRIAIVHCGLESEFFGHSAPLRADPLRIACVGRLCAEKAQIDFVRALAVATKNGCDVQAILVGDGPMRGVIEDELSNLGIEDKVTLAGWKTPGEVAEVLQGASLFALPSYAEGLPVSIMEAMALGRPVISTYVAGIPELVIPGENGWLVPAGDVSALSQAIIAAAKLGENELARMGQAARTRVTARHHIDRSAEILRDLFLLAEGRDLANAENLDAAA